MADTNTARVAAKIRYFELADVFHLVLRTYSKLGELSTLAAINNDEEAPRNNTLGPASIAVHFKIDVERTTERILKGDKPAQDAWFSLLAGETVDPKIAKSVIKRCGEVYAELQLHRYFEPTIRRGRARATA